MPGKFGADLISLGAIACFRALTDSLVKPQSTYGCYSVVHHVLVERMTETVTGRYRTIRPGFGANRLQKQLLPCESGAVFLDCDKIRVQGDSDRSSRTLHPGDASRL
jgi:hypothetical protein